MHEKLKSISKKLKKLEGKKLTDRQQQMLDGAKLIIDGLQQKQLTTTLTIDDEKVLDAVIVIVDYLVKDSSVT